VARLRLREAPPGPPRTRDADQLAHAKLDQLAKATDSGESLQKEIRELTNQEAAIIEDAEGAKAASDVASLRSSMRRAPRR
jgi:hypothetical protein